MVDWGRWRGGRMGRVRGERVANGPGIVLTRAQRDDIASNAAAAMERTQTAAKDTPGELLAPVRQNTDPAGTDRGRIVKSNPGDAVVTVHTPQRPCPRLPEE